MGIKCSKCNAPQPDSRMLLHQEHSCHYHTYDDIDKICQDCRINPMIHGGNCKHRFKYQVCGIFCCYA